MLKRAGKPRLTFSNGIWWVEWSEWTTDNVDTNRKISEWQHRQNSAVTPIEPRMEAGACGG